MENGLESVAAEEKAADASAAGGDQKQADKFETDPVGWVGDQMKEGAAEASDDGAADTAGKAPSGSQEGRTELSGAEIPDEFTDAALAAGWSEEDVVKFAANYTDAELLEVVPLIEKPDTTEVEGGQKSVDAGTKKAEVKAAVPAGDKELEAFKAGLREEITKELLAKFEPNIGQLNELKADMQRREAVTLLSTANAAFDNASAEFDVFGKTAELPVFPAGPMKGQPVPNSRQFKAREEVFGVAQAFVRGGRSLPDAMDDAIAWYRGKHGQKDAQRKLIRDLKQQETRLSGARTGKVTKKTFSNERDEMINSIQEEMDRVKLGE